MFSIRKTLVCSATVIALGFGSAAMAKQPADTGNNANKGNQGCALNATGETYKNPGEMFQAIREISGKNPKGWVDRPGIGAETVGEFINRRCVVAD